MILFLGPAHSIRYSFTNEMATGDPVGSMRHRTNSGSGGEEGTKFIRCFNKRQTQILEVWTYREHGVTPEVHPTARVDVGAGFVGKFATNYFTPSWRRIPMFGGNSINGSVEWLGILELLRNDGPPWTLNLLAPYDNWEDRGSSTSTNWGSGSGGHSGGVSTV